MNAMRSNKRIIMNNSTIIKTYKYMQEEPTLKPCADANIFKLRETKEVLRMIRLYYVTPIYKQLIRPPLKIRQ